MLMHLLFLFQTVEGTIMMSVELFPQFVRCLFTKEHQKKDAK